MKEERASDKALRLFADLMIEKIKEVAEDWKKPWFSPESGGGLPRNIEGREYNGINSFMLYLLSEERGYKMQLYMTFMQAKEAGASILRGEKSFPVVYWNFSVKDKNGHKITIDDYRKLSEEEKQEYKITPYMKTYNVFNISQTNYAEIQPEKWEKLKSQFSAPSLRDEKDMYTMPLIDTLIKEKEWVCPIYLREKDEAYYLRGEDGYIIVPQKVQFKDGESFYSTLLHEMAHSTGEVGLLEREKGEIFGDKKYAKEELIAELTSATCGKSMGISTCIREENAIYLKSWLSTLEEDPKFIYNILSDVSKASNMILEKVNRMESKLSNENKFLLAASQVNIEKLQALKDIGYTPQEQDIKRLKANTISGEGREAIKNIFGIEIDHKKELVESSIRESRNTAYSMNV